MTTLKQSWPAALAATSLLASLPVVADAGHLAAARETVKEFTTYPFSDPDPVADPGSRIYPYFRYDGFTDQPVKKKWKVVELENDYIKLTIMPEIGGKIWTAIDKRTGKAFIYNNDVVKFRDIAMRGPWTSGGIEANFGIMGHAPSVANPVDYLVLHKPDGSVSCVIGGLDLLTQSQWRMEINLPKDKAYFTTTPFWYSSRPIEEPYYVWMNSAVKASGGLQYQFPGQYFVGHDGEVRDWPIDRKNGKDVSRYDDNDFGTSKSYHVAGKYSEYWGAYWKDEDFGMGHYAERGDMPGKKIWIWGLSQQGMIWERLLTDHSGQYSELQSGRLFNQSSDKSTFSPFKHRGFAPFGTDTWSEYWFPVRGTKGYRAVNRYGALNLSDDGGKPKVYFYALQQVDEVLSLSIGGKTTYHRTLHLKPGEVFTDDLPTWSAGQAPVLALGGNKLVYDATPGHDLLNRPTAMPADFDWHSAYGLYMQGKEQVRAREFAKAESSLKASLHKDHNFVPALAELATLDYRNHRYDEALELARRALAIDTYDPASNFVYGLVNDKLGHTADAKDGFDIAALDMGYRSAASTELAELSLRSGEAARAEEFARRALVTNQYNIEALQTLAVSYRLTGQEAKAQQVLKTILGLDPLNHFARSEQYLWHPSAATRVQLQSSIRSELPAQTYIELADWYSHNGLKDAALGILALAPRHAEVLYREAYLGDKPLDMEQVDLREILPFRAETRDILEHLIATNKDWRLKYHLALIEWFNNDRGAAQGLFRQIGDAPRMASFYATRAKLFPEQAEADLEKARQLDPAEWRYVKALANHYLERGAEAQALSLVEPFYPAHPDHIIGMLYAKTLLRNGRYADAESVMAKLDVLPNEGATEGIALYREAKLMQAVRELKLKHYDAALRYIDAARDWPRNLGVGKPYSTDVDERMEDWLSYLTLHASGNEKLAQENLSKVLAFVPRIDNTIRNFEPANLVVSAWALKTAGRSSELPAAMTAWTAKDPGAPIYSWCRAVLDSGRPSEQNGARNEGAARVINELLK